MLIAALDLDCNRIFIGVPSTYCRRNASVGLGIIIYDLFLKPLRSRAHVKKASCKMNLIS